MGEKVAATQLKNRSNTKKLKGNEQNMLGGCRKKLRSNKPKRLNREKQQNKEHREKLRKQPRN